MNRSNRIATDGIDLATWSIVDESNMKVGDRERFQKLKFAVERLSYGEPLQAISNDIGLSPRVIGAQWKRCLAMDSNGVVAGYRALIKNSHVVPYVRTAPSKPKPQTEFGGLAGEFSRLLETYPTVGVEIRATFLKLKRGQPQLARIPIQRMHKCFLGLCRQVGIKSPDYPFNAKHLGRTALQRYLRSLAGSDPIRFALARGGRNEARMAAVRLAEPTNRSKLQPYDLMYLDGHTQDCNGSLELTGPSGAVVQIPIARLGLIITRDHVSGAILSAQPTFGVNETQEDVLAAIEKGLVGMNGVEHRFANPWKSDWGFPADKIRELKWAKFNTIHLDNAAAHKANSVRHALCTKLKTTVGWGKAAFPEARTLVEQGIKQIEVHGGQQMASTTGSHPKDSRRQNPTEQAVRWRISIRDLQELFISLAAAFNAKPSEHTDSLSPLEYLEQWVKRETTTINYIPVHERDAFTLAEITYQNTVRGQPEKGAPAYVQIEHVKYRCPELTERPELIGKCIVARLRFDDFRYADLFLLDGTLIGRAWADGKWRHFAHGYRERKWLFANYDRRMLKYLEDVDPLEQLENDLVQRAVKRGGKGTSKLAAQVARLKDREANKGPIIAPAEIANSSVGSSHQPTKIIPAPQFRRGLCI